MSMSHGQEWEPQNVNMLILLYVQFLQKRTGSWELVFGSIGTQLGIGTQVGKQFSWKPTDSPLWQLRSIHLTWLLGERDLGFCEPIGKVAMHGMTRSCHLMKPEAVWIVRKGELAVNHQSLWHGAWVIPGWCSMHLQMRMLMRGTVHSHMSQPVGVGKGS